MSKTNRDNAAIDNSDDPQQPSTDTAPQGTQQGPQQASQPVPTEQDLESWSADSDRKTKSWYSIPSAVWVLAITVLIIVGAAGFLAGSRLINFNSMNTVNMADVASGKEEITPVPGPNGDLDASIYRPKVEAQLKFPKDMDNVCRRNENGPFALGAVDVPVIISIYSGLECPFYVKFVNETEPGLMEKYVNEGLVRLEWDDMTTNSEKATKDVEAEHVVAVQGKFWKFFRTPFKKAGEKGQDHPEFTERELIAVVHEVGILDMKCFEKGFKGGKWIGAVENATQLGSMLGISGILGFLAGTQFVSGTQPLDVFEGNIGLVFIRTKRMEEANKQVALTDC